MSQQGRLTLALSRPLLCFTVNIMVELIRRLQSSHSTLPVSPSGFVTSPQCALLEKGSKTELAVKLKKMLQSFVRGVGGSSRTMHGLCSPPSTRWDYSCAAALLQMHTVDTPPIINLLRWPHCKHSTVQNSTYKDICAVFKQPSAPSPLR